MVQLIQSLNSLSYTLKTELKHWQNALLRSTTSPESQYSFLQNVPYLSETGNHSTIEKKEPKLVNNPYSAETNINVNSKNLDRRKMKKLLDKKDTAHDKFEKKVLNHDEHTDDETELEFYTDGALVSRIELQILSQDIIYIILEYLDCKSLLNVSCISSWYYFMCHEERFWAKWLLIENSRLMYIQESHTSLNSSASVTFVEAHQLKLLRSFYTPSPQEEVYSRFQNFALLNIQAQFSGDDVTDEVSNIFDEESDGFSVQEIAAQTPFPLYSPIEEDTTTIEELSPSQTLEYIQMREEQQNYGSYLMFRKLKLRNPFIRSRLIRIYTHELKERYGMLTKWINHGKLAAAIFLTIGTILLSLQLDRLVNWWWGFVFFPFLVGAVLTSALVIVLWLPTLQWPISLYRWVGKDYVGCWTSWAYTITLRARWIQLIFGVWAPFTIFIAFAHVTIPSIIPSWGIFMWIGIGTLIWSLTSTQFVAGKLRKRYATLLFLISQSFVLFTALAVLKLAILDGLLSQIPYLNFYWIFPFLPLGFSLLFIFILVMRVSWDLHKMGNSRIPCGCMVWSFQYSVFHSLISIFLFLLWIRLELGSARILPPRFRHSIGNINYFFIFIPLEIVEIFIILYYALRCYTKLVNQTSLKFPFLLIGGKSANALNHDYDRYIV